MKLRSILLALASLLVLTACPIGSVIQYIHTNSFAYQYVITKHFELSEPRISQDGSSVSFTLDFTGEGAAIDYREEVFHQIAQENGDTGWDAEIMERNYAGQWPIYIYPDLVRIDVTSNQDYDDEHPAGTLLNDCFSLAFSTAYEYISSGYKNKDQLVHKRILLSELTSQDMRIMHDYPGLYIERLPENRGIHELRFVLYYANGLQWAKRFEVDFDQVFPE